MKKKSSKKISPLQTAQEISFPVKNPDGDVLAGVLHKAHKKSTTLVIAIHGFLSHKSQTLLKQTCIDLARAGYDAYRFDLSGNGDSEGRFEDATMQKMQRDVLSVLQSFKGYKRIMLLGHSLGGVLALLTASRAKIDGIIVIGTPAHMERFDERLSAEQKEQLRSVGFTTWTVHRPVGDIPYTITERFIRETKEMNLLDAMKMIQCKALVAHGAIDRVVPVTDAQEIAGGLAHKNILLIGGADHNFTKPELLDALIDGIIDWINDLK